MAVATREMQYEPVPNTGIYLATTKALDETGRPIVEITWYETKRWVQKRGLVLPYSKEWSTAREYFQISHPEIEQDMITGPREWTDSLVAHPNRDGNYASNLSNSRLPKRGKHPLLIEGSVVIKRNDGSYVIDGGEVRELSDFPKRSGTLRKSIPELGLIEGAYLYTNDDFAYDEGLRPVFRGDRWGVLDGRFDTGVGWGPSDSVPDWGFRPARRGLVETGTEPETDFVKGSTN